MSSDPPSSDDPVGRFFREARRALVDGAQSFNYGHDELLRIVTDPMKRFDFEIRFKPEINNPDLEKLILIYLESMSERLEKAADKAERGADLTTFGATIPGGISVAAIVAMTVTGAATGGIGPLIMLGFGLAGVAALTHGRYNLRGKMNENKAAAREIRQLVASLRQLK